MNPYFHVFTFVWTTMMMGERLSRTAREIYGICHRCFENLWQSYHTDIELTVNTYPLWCLRVSELTTRFTGQLMGLNRTVRSPNSQNFYTSSKVLGPDIIFLWTFFLISQRGITFSAGPSKQGCCITGRILRIETDIDIHGIHNLSITPFIAFYWVKFRKSAQQIGIDN